MKKQWWHGKIAYQIYPKSFCDANGDGIGDLRGILSKLDYLKDLGVDIVWISPIYRSPFVDQGYDIADYYAIDPVFGTMEEFDLLLAEAKKRGIGIVMDLVINHCSDQHEWFKAAVADPTGPAAQRFYFRKGRNGQPPSNYRSYFGGPAWDKVPGQEDLWYLHLFAKEQPDLNWYSEPLREELFRMVNWWLDKGLAGFRVDAIINIQKQLDFPCYPADGPDGLVSCTRMVEESRDAAFFLSQLRDKAFAPHEAFTVGEVFSLRSEQVQEFIGEGGYFSTMFDFSAALLNELEPGRYERKPFDFKQWRSTLFNSQAACPRDGFLANIIENHDEPRGASTFLPEHAKTPEGAKLLGTVSLMLRGLPFLYQGQELGMTNCPWESIDEIDDVSTKGAYRLALQAGVPESLAMEGVRAYSRDNARTPMQWSARPGAGFTEGTPWLRLNPNYTAVNAEAQAGDPNSVLGWYKRLIALRKSPRWAELFTYGETEPQWQNSEWVFAFDRVLDGQRVRIAANFGPEAVHLPCEGQVLLANRADCNGGQLTLESCGAAILTL